jgi:hypothetical protein
MVDNLETERNSFSVVSFPIDNSVEAVPTKWLSEDRQFCPWPKKAGNSVHFRKLLQDSSSSPGLNWEQFQINVIKEYGKSVEYIIFSSLHGLISIQICVLTIDNALQMFMRRRGKRLINT